MSGFVHASDWHLSRLTWQHRPRLWGDSFFALEQIVDFCIRQEAVLFGAGDLLDKDRPESAAVACMHKQMDRMEEARLPVYYVQGQHEKADPPWMSSHPWPIHLHKQACSVPGVNGVFYGLDWMPRDQFAEAITEMANSSRSGPVYLVCHQVWSEHMGNVITVPEANMQQVACVADIVLSGDYHVHQLTRHITQFGEQLLVSPGSISVRNMGEEFDKQFWYHDGTRFHSIPLRGRPWVRTFIHTPDHLAQLEQLKATLELAGASLPDNIKTPMCIFQYPSDLEGAHKRLNEVFGDCHLWLEEQRSEVAPQDVAIQNASEALSLPDLIAVNVPAGEIQEHLLQLMNPELPPKEAVRNLVLQLNPAKG